jgi:multidrug efflux pump subunit AcrA (membrane-fusion protein)
MMSKRFYSAVALAIASALPFACSSEKTTEAESIAVSAPVSAVSLQPVARMHSFAGTVRSSAISSLAARIPGDVVAVHVTEGDRVRKGQLLVEIDARDADAQVAMARAGEAGLARAIASATSAIASAEAQAAFAEATWKRFAALRERGSVSVQEYESAHARHLSAAAELERARQTRQQLIAQRDGAAASAAQAGTLSSYTRIRAPFDGIISARLVDPGAQASPGTPLLTIDSASRYRVEATVDETANVAVSDPVIVEIGNASIQARVAHVVPSLDPRTRTALIMIDLPQGTGWRSGSYARVQVRSGDAQAIVVPVDAIVRRGQVTGVFVVEKEGRALLRLVTLGETTDGRVEVLSGLKAGERIVTNAAPSLREGVLIAELQR